MRVAPPGSVTRGLIHYRDKQYVGSNWLNRVTEYEVKDPATGEHHPSPVARDVIWVVIRARGEEICRLTIPITELMGDTPYVPPTKGRGDEGRPYQTPLLP